MYGAEALPIRLVDSSFSITMTNTWLKAGMAGVGVGVGAGVGVGVGVGAGVGVGVGADVGAGVGVGVDAGVGVATGLGVAVEVALVLGVGAGLLTGVDVGCAELVGFAVGPPALLDADGVVDGDGARATGGCDMDPGVKGGPSKSDVIHKSSPPTATQMTSRRTNHMSGTPPTHH